MYPTASETYLKGLSVSNLLIPRGLHGLKAMIPTRANGVRGCRIALAICACWSSGFPASRESTTSHNSGRMAPSYPYASDPLYLNLIGLVIISSNFPETNGLIRD